MIIGNVRPAGDDDRLDSFWGVINLFPPWHRLEINRNRKKQSERDPDFLVTALVQARTTQIGTGWIRPNSYGEMIIYLRVHAPASGQAVLHAHLEPSDNMPEGSFDVVWPTN